ncbi:UNVERIFIED_CONTAM: Scarecrow-like transcription factor PAT1 [Sesamum radiatum]|uniref:Scarecrow-like transcription factor PAT1 n=1 Tax=Sesamum radiatum TaxID=300843 RepID=A0AAW2JF64_SESRA
MFESIDVTMPRDRKERINVEQHCLARDIVNIIACEGKERVERHELFGKWRLRFMMAGWSYAVGMEGQESGRHLLGTEEMGVLGKHVDVVVEYLVSFLGWNDVIIP